MRNKAIHIALGVRADGAKEVPGLWLEQNEGAKFWLRVMNELRNRGAEDILLAVVDGLKGFPEAINAVFPEAIVQTCWCRRPLNGIAMCQDEVVEDHTKETVHGRSYSNRDRHVKACFQLHGVDAAEKPVLRKRNCSPGCLRGVAATAGI